MKKIGHLWRLSVLFLTIFLFVFPAHACFEFNQHGDNQRHDLGYYYVITGGKFPTGNVPNGDDASGGTFRYLSDDPAMGSPIDTWIKATFWVAENAGLALTLMNGSDVVYDNNGIEDGTGEGFYDYSSAGCEGDWPGLYRGYSMANNFDFISASYFKLAQETTFDRIIGYFDPTFSGVADFKPYSPHIRYRMNIWSSIQDDPDSNPNSYMPAVTSFTGNVFSTDSKHGEFQVSETGVNRVFPVCPELPFMPIDPDPIWRLVFELDRPVTLTGGVYFFSHDAVVVAPVVIDIKPGIYPNSINLKSKGVIPVAVLTASEFDASTVAPSTVVLAGASPVRWTKKDVDDDGDLDMLFHFKTEDLMLNENSTEAILIGSTQNGIPLKGTDTVNIVFQQE
jgi:hypothetical protein